MSSFDISKQEELAKWEEGKNSGDLIVGVYRYNNGAPKVGFNRYASNRDGELIIIKSGRLSWEDLMYFESILEEIKQTMEEVK